MASLASKWAAILLLPTLALTLVGCASESRSSVVKLHFQRKLERVKIQGGSLVETETIQRSTSTREE